MKIAWIQGLRAIAVLLVVFNHLELRFFKNGYLGVDIFFVLSGYLISMKLETLYDHSSGLAEYLKTFYKSRMRRILPLAFGGVAATLVLFYLVPNPYAGKELSVDALFALLFASNFRTQQVGMDYFQRASEFQPLLHYWSLSIEEQFYVLWPLILFIIFKLAKKFSNSNLPLMLCSALFFFSIFYGVKNRYLGTGLDYFNSISRFYELISGAIVFFVLKKLHLSFGVLKKWLLLLICAFFILSIVFVPNSNYPIVIRSFGITITTSMLILILSLSQDSCVKRVLETRWLVFIGNISFSLYIWHWIIITFFPPQKSAFSQSKLFLFVIIFAVSILSYKLIESPFHRINPVNVTRSLVKLRYISIVYILLLLSLLFVVHQGTNSSTIANMTRNDSPVIYDNIIDFPEYWNRQLKTAYINRETTTINVSHVENILGEWDGPVQSFLTNAQPKQTKRAVIFGDSLAQRIAPMLTSNLDPEIWEISMYSFPGCPINFPEITASDEPCAKFKLDFFARVKQLKPDLLLIISDHTIMDLGENGQIQVTDWAVESLSRTLELITKNSSLTFYIGRYAQMSKTTTECASSKLTINECSGNQNVVDNVNKVLQKSSSNLGIKFIDPSDWFCYQKFCPNYVDGFPLFIDHVHPTENFSEILGKLFRPYLQAFNLSGLLSKR
jgi:peptidoglycan/LPS O-acetylase OafA/YrhL